MPSNIVRLSREFGVSAWRAAKENFLVLGAGVLLTGLAEYLLGQQSWLYHIARDIGIAFVVAFVVIISIEQRSRKELTHVVHQFLTDSSDRLLAAILGVEFPPQMYAFAREKLMREPFYRFDTRVNYVLKRPEDRLLSKFDWEILILDLDFQYQIRNLSHRDETFSLMLFVDEKFPNHTGADLPAGFGEIKVLVNETPLSKDQLAAAARSWPDTPGLRRYKHKVEMKPKEDIKVQIKYSTTKLIADSETWRSIHPCDGVEVFIQFPDDITVLVDGVHPDGIKPIAQESTYYQGEITRPLFPHNGFMFWWYPRDIGQSAPKKQILDARASAPQGSVG